MMNYIDRCVPVRLESITAVGCGQKLPDLVRVLPMRGYGLAGRAGIRNTVPEEVRVKRQDLMRASYEFQEICHIDAYVSMNSLYQWNAEAKTWSKSVNTFLETVVIP